MLPVLESSEDGPENFSITVHRGASATVESPSDERNFKSTGFNNLDPLLDYLSTEKRAVLTRKRPVLIETNFPQRFCRI